MDKPVPWWAFIPAACFVGGMIWSCAAPFPWWLVGFPVMVLGGAAQSIINWRRWGR